MHAAAGQALEAALGRPRLGARGAHRGAPLRGGRQRAGGRLLRQERRAAPRDQAARGGGARLRPRHHARRHGQARAGGAGPVARRRSRRPFASCARRPTRWSSATASSTASIKPAGLARSGCSARVAAGQLLAAAQHMEEARQRLSEAEDHREGRRVPGQAVLIAEARARDAPGRLQRSHSSRSERLDEHRARRRATCPRSTASRCSSRRRTPAWAIGARRWRSLQEAEQLLPGDRTAAARAHEGARPRRLLHAATSGRPPSTASGRRRGPRAGHHLRGHAQPAQPGRHPRPPAATCRAPTARSGSRSRSARRAATTGSPTTTGCSSRSSTVCRAPSTATSCCGRASHTPRASDFIWDVIGGRILLAHLLNRGGQLGAARERVRADPSARGDGRAAVRGQRVRRGTGQAGGDAVGQGSRISLVSDGPPARPGAARGCRRTRRSRRAPPCRRGGRPPPGASRSRRRPAQPWPSCRAPAPAAPRRGARRGGMFARPSGASRTWSAASKERA